MIKSYFKIQVILSNEKFGIFFPFCNKASQQNDITLYYKR